MTRDFRLPDLGEGISEGEVLKVLIAEGDMVAEDQPLMEIETDKAAIEVPSPFAGRVARIHVQAGDTVAVGAVLVSIADGEPAAQTVPQENVPAPKPQTQPPPRPVPATPATRRRARELGVDLRAITGSGPNGRVTQADLEAFASRAAV